VSVSGQDERDRAHHLMMAALDGELADADRAELDRFLAGDERLRKEWTQLGRVKEVTKTMAYREPPDEIWDDYWTSVYNRTERGIGWILASIGAIVVLGYGIWIGLQELLADTDLPAFLKLGIFALLLGGLVLLVSVIREKLFTRGKDPYKEVQR
jgi:ferric-dicitrate binding protein FerR (iron transport regulator)